MRMKVKIDITKPFRRGLKIATGKNESKWVDIKYETMGDFLYYCGTLGHIDKYCTFYEGYGETNNQLVLQLWPLDEGHHP
ncbi:T-complex protein 1 subunit eta [Bienertia sinuspersici]